MYLVALAMLLGAAFLKGAQGTGRHGRDVTVTIVLSFESGEVLHHRLQILDLQNLDDWDEV